VPIVSALASLTVSWVYSAMGVIPGYDLYLLSTSVQVILIVYLARRAWSCTPGTRWAAHLPAHAGGSTHSLCGGLRLDG
jgi:hypothetical protein